MLSGHSFAGLLHYRTLFRKYYKYRQQDAIISTSSIVSNVELNLYVSFVCE